MRRLFLLVLGSLFLFSCSLTYKSEEPDVTHVPELVFSNARYVSYQEGKVSMVLDADILEQYQNDGALYGSQVFFTTYNKEGELSAEGRSQMISANNSDELYALLGQVEIQSFEEDLVIKADSLSWDGKAEQLVTGALDTIELKKNSKAEAVSSQDGEQSSSRMELTGTGFSASGSTMDFQFTGAVSGKIYTNKTEGHGQ